jgi:DNA-binding CsgD family transcriptional regulator
LSEFAKAYAQGQFLVNGKVCVPYFDHGDRELREVPSSQRRPTPGALAEYETESKSRNEAIYQAYMSGGYTLKQIGEHFDLHYSTVSGIIKYQRSKT